MIKDFTVNIKDLYIVYLHSRGMNYKQIKIFMGQEGYEITTQTISKSIKRVYIFFGIKNTTSINQDIMAIFHSEIENIFEDISLLSKKIDEKTKLINKISIMCLPVLMGYFVDSWGKSVIDKLNKRNINIEFSEGLIDNCTSSLLSERVDFAISFSSKMYPMINEIDTKQNIESKIISGDFISPYFAISQDDCVNNNLPLNEWDRELKKYYSYKIGTLFYHLVKVLLGTEIHQFTPLDEFDSSASMLNRLLSSETYSAIAWLPDGLVQKRSYGSAKIRKNNSFGHEVDIKIYRVRNCRKKIANDVWDVI